MASYPGSIYEPRAKENKIGVEYDPAKKTIPFAEDVTKLDDEVVAIETDLIARRLGVSPIGAVVAWLKSFADPPALPSGWVECNGQFLDDAESIYNGQTLPNLNGVAATKRFLRGSTTSGTIGGSETHFHSWGTCVSSGTPSPPPATVQAGTGAVAANPCHVHTISVGGNTGAKSTLSSYYEIVWIMRTK